MLEAYQQYLANAEALAEQDATNTGWQQDLLILSRKRQSKLSPRKAAKPTEHLGVSELKTFSPQQRVRVGPDINIFPSYSITFPITKSTVDMKHLTVLTFIAIVLALTIASSLSGSGDAQSGGNDGHLHCQHHTNYFILHACPPQQATAMGVRRRRFFLARDYVRSRTQRFSDPGMEMR